MILIRATTIGLLFLVGLGVASCQSGPAPVEECQPNDNTFRCVKFISNYDGDTIRFDISGVHPLIGKNVAVRLKGVDAPEIRSKNACEKKKAIEARQVVERALSTASEIELSNIERGKYFRIIADVLVDGVSLTHILLKKGLAYYYQGGKKPKVDWCALK